MARWLAPLACMLGCPLVMAALMWRRPGDRKATQPASAAPLSGPSTATGAGTDAAAAAVTQPNWVRKLWCAACLNWKVIAGLAAVAGGIALVRPVALVVAGPVLLLLVCPMSMLVAMVAMSRRQSDSGSTCHAPPQRAMAGHAEPETSSALSPANSTSRQVKG